MTANIRSVTSLPVWVPDAVRLYLSHTEEGVSLRALARSKGCHPSTVLRQVRRFENRRDDPLVDAALAQLGRSDGDASSEWVENGTSQTSEDTPSMTASFRSTPTPMIDPATISREARRILRRLSEAQTMLVVAPDMPNAVVLKQMPDGASNRIAVVERTVAQVFALKDWIACRHNGRVATYAITATGRMALRRLLAEEGGSQEAAADGFAEQHRDWDVRGSDAAVPGFERLRLNLAESPVAMLSRRRDRDGTPFLSAAQVAAAERLREDFELAQMGPRIGQNWDRFLTAGERGGFGSGRGPAEGPRAARERVAAALRDLGPGLGDVVLRCCCFLEGLEATERRMGWSARSGKIVLRIALTRLQRHYEEQGKAPRLIG